MSEEHDKLLPIANVGRIMKRILPTNAKISKEAKERMQECVSEFISFVTGEASHRCHQENRKTISGDDLCRALDSLGFDNYSRAMSRYLDKFREFQMLKAADRGGLSSRNNNNNNNSNNDNCNTKGYSSDDDEGSNVGNSDGWIDFGILERGGN